MAIFNPSAPQMTPEGYVKAPGYRGITDSAGNFLPGTQDFQAKPTMMNNNASQWNVLNQDKLALQRGQQMQDVGRQQMAMQNMASVGPGRLSGLSRGMGQGQNAAGSMWDRFGNESANAAMQAGAKGLNIDQQNAAFANKAKLGNLAAKTGDITGFNDAAKFNLEEMMKQKQGRDMMNAINSQRTAGPGDIQKFLQNPATLFSPAVGLWNTVNLGKGNTQTSIPGLSLPNF